MKPLLILAMLLALPVMGQQAQTAKDSAELRKNRPGAWLVYIHGEYMPLDSALDKYQKEMLDELPPKKSSSLFYDDSISAVNDTGLTRFSWFEQNGPAYTGDVYGETTLTIEGMLRLWDQYRAECFADSTHTMTLGDEHIKVYGRGLAPNGHTTVWRDEIWTWEHRQPTFEGFLEFIRGK